MLHPFRLLSPAGRGARLSIFIFHRVLEVPDPLRPGEPDVLRFDRLVAFIVRHFRVLALPEAVRRLREQRLPAAAACITFDDGYADNHHLAAPVLRRHGATATFFVATGFIDGGRMWNDTVIEAVRRLPQGVHDLRELELDRHEIGDMASRQRVSQQLLARLKYLPPPERGRCADALAALAQLPPHSDLMMTREQVRALRDLGMDIGAHTVSHPILARLEHAEAREEIAAGRETLAQWLGEPPALFAYPNGIPGQDYGARDVALVRQAGYLGAVSTSAGAADAGCDLHQLPRFTPWDRPLPKFGLRCALNFGRRGEHVQDIAPARDACA